MMIKKYTIAIVLFIIAILLWGCTVDKITTIQEPIENFTAQLTIMQDGWSLGNACDTNTGLFVTDGPVNLNGWTLEILDGELTINGDLTYNGGTVDSLCISSKVFVLGNTFY